MGARVHVQAEPSTWLPGLVVLDDRGVVTVVCACGFVHVTDRERLLSDMAGFGIPCAWVDMLTGFSTGTMLRPSDQHLNWPTGDKFIAQALYNKLSADGYLSGAYKLLLIGHSHVAGGPTLTPSSTAQFRPWLARLTA